MAYEFKFPDVGEGIHEGRIVKWRVKEGEIVKLDQVLGDIETDKAIVEIPSPKAGTILKLGAKEGEMIKVGEILAVIGEKGETAKEATEVGSGKGVGVVGDLEEAPEEEEEKSVPGHKEISAISALPPSLLVLPAIRKLASDLKVDLANVKGTGHGGRIIEEDVRKAAGEKPAEKPSSPRVVKKYDLYGYVDRVPYKGAQRAVGDHMVASAFQAPHATLMDEADVTELWELREKQKKAAEKENVKLTFLPFIIKAVIAALKEHPKLNSTLDEQNQEIIVKKYYNIGFAVDTGESLMVPVIKIADSKSLFDLVKEITGLAEKAREKKLNLGDMKGGTFTITNFGSIGGMFAVPIINFPEAAIAGLGKIHDAPKVMGKKVAIRKIMGLSLAFDHRILNGADAARFLNTLISHLENPNALL